MFGVIIAEAKKLARNPGRLKQVFYPRRWRQFLGILAFNVRTGNRWQQPSAADRTRRREYASYDQYLRHQQSKFAHLDLTEYDRAYRAQLGARLEQLSLLKPGMNVLCLGARQGTEVKAFHDAGCFAVGIDLNPGGNNKFVLPGDFHDVQFPTASVEVLFTNSFDHVFDPEKLIREMIRLLKPGGMLIVEAMRGEEENNSPDYYASFWWRKIDDLVALLSRHQFEVLQRNPFSEPWPGEQICLRKG